MVKVATATTGRRCRHAFEAASVHANGDVVCSIIDGRGEYVLGNVHHSSLRDILRGPRAEELRRLVVSTDDAYCRAVGKTCALKTLPAPPGEVVDTRLRFLAIEPTTTCDLRCLSCPIRDIAGDTSWRDAYADGGMAFAAWDITRRAKQTLADGVQRVLPATWLRPVPERSRAEALLLRGRMPAGRRGTLPLDVVCRVMDEAGPQVERLDFFNYGEPFLYKPLVPALRHARQALPHAVIAISTDGQQVRPETEAALVDERLVDCLVFSVDGVDEDTYQRYRIGGTFARAWAHLSRAAARAAGTPVRVVWQYVVFRWNDDDRHLDRARAMAAELGVPIWFDFAHTWGRSERAPDDLRRVASNLRPFTALPGEPRQQGW